MLPSMDELLAVTSSQSLVSPLYSSPDLPSFWKAVLGFRMAADDLKGAVQA